jgi:hypothetical protein
MDWKEATGDGTVIDLVREGREKGEQGIWKSESEMMENKGINVRTLRVSVLTAHTALEVPT